MSAARQVGGEKQTKQVSETAKRAAMRPEGGYVDLNLTREGSRRMVLRRDKVEIGNSGSTASLLWVASRSGKETKAGDEE